MSLKFVKFATSRHLRPHLISNANSASYNHLRIGGGNLIGIGRRNFSSNHNGSGLRRTQTKGKRTTATVRKVPPSQPKSAASSSSSGGASSAPKHNMTSDPHSIANERVSAAGAKRTPGTESVATLTNEQKLSNFAMAGGLLAFVSYIFYYSLASVGGDENAKSLIFGRGDTQQQQEGDGDEGDLANPGFEEFLKEANEGRSAEDQRLKAERDARGEVRELMELESSTSARLKAEGVEDDVIVVGSVTEEEEREMARVAGFEEGGEDKAIGSKKRPLWKRVVLFWRKE